MKKKTVSKFLTAALSCVLALFGFAGCTVKDVPDTVDTLEIYIQELGYGIQWLNDEIELFHGMKEPAGVVGIEQGAELFLGAFEI